MDRNSRSKATVRRLRPALLLALLVLASPVRSQTVVLVEAEGFVSHGGWGLDTQFVDVMGSSYLIAHGLGVPVTDAVTTVAFPETGDYRVWVRTRNWVPAYSNAAAPGRFRVAFNGADLAPVFGETGGAWHWQDGGTVTVAGATATLALRDLTGFDGRCDAIAFVRGSDAPPPDGGADLAAWRRAVLGESETPAISQPFDCVIVGGGVAGCCAALAAARAGVHVALVQDRPVPGGNASQEVRVATRGATRHPIVEEIDTTDLSNRGEGTVARDAARIAILQAEPDLVLLMPWRAYAAGTNVAGRVAHVDIRHAKTGERRRLTAPLFIDCTGDAWVGYWAGAEYRMGRESAAEFGESLAPAVADARTMGNSLMWTTRTAASPVTFPAVPWAMSVAGTRADTGGEWNWEYGMSLDTIADAEQIRDHLLRAIYGNFWNAKQKIANTNLAFAWVPYVAGKRESRRLLGDHVVTQGDLVNGVYFEDAIATTDWGIDLHSETAVSYLSTYKKTSVKSPCYFPFRSLYSRNVPNLMMAGRAFSCTHVGIGSPRVMNTCGQMGVAVGIAAAICTERGIEPRDIYRSRDLTVELQSRIAGTWPARPPPAGASATILDNTNAPPGVVTVGEWTSSSSVTGYYATSYLLDGNTGRGTKRVAFTPPSLTPGTYAISLRWAADSNRSSNTPVWVCTAPSSDVRTASADLHIRNTQSNDTFATGEMLVGRVAASDYMRGLLQFDLSSLPAGAAIVSTELQLEIGSLDTNTAAGFVGADGLKVHRVTAPFTPAETTWARRAAGTNWAVPGGDFDAAALSTIGTPTDPNLCETGDVFVFPRTAALAAAAAEARRSGEPLGLMVRTPTLESSFAARKLYRFGAARLTVGYHVPRLPATTTVNQRMQGGQWVGIGSHTVPPEGLTVIVGNDAASGYVVADAVRFANASATTNDYDGDGMADTWERYYFLSETGATAEDDDDGDGRSNRIEFMTGTDPHDAHSRFEMRRALEEAPGTFTMNWASAAGRTYRIEMSGNLVDFEPFVTGIPATPPANAHPVPRAPTNVYYRVVLEPAET